MGEDLCLCGLCKGPTSDYICAGNCYYCSDTVCSHCSDKLFIINEDINSCINCLNDVDINDSLNFNERNKYNKLLIKIKQLQKK